MLGWLALKSLTSLRMAGASVCPSVYQKVNFATPPLLPPLLLPQAAKMRVARVSVMAKKMFCRFICVEHLYRFSWVRHPTSERTHCLRGISRGGTKPRSARMKENADGDGVGRRHAPFRVCTRALYVLLCGKLNRFSRCAGHLTADMIPE